MSAPKPEPKFGWQGEKSEPKGVEPMTDWAIAEEGIADTLERISELSQQMKDQQDRLQAWDLAIFWSDPDELPERRHETISYWTDSEAKFQDWYANRLLVPGGISREEAHHWMREYTRCF